MSASRHGSLIAGSVITGALVAVAVLSRLWTPGSPTRLAIADKLVELKAVCACGRKATMNLRVDATGRAVREGVQTEIGGNDRYVAVCRRHFSQAFS